MNEYLSRRSEIFLFGFVLLRITWICIISVLFLSLVSHKYAAVCQLFQYFIVHYRDSLKTLLLIGLTLSYRHG